MWEAWPRFRSRGIPFSDLLEATQWFTSNQGQQRNQIMITYPVEGKFASDDRRTQGACRIQTAAGVHSLLQVEDKQKFEYYSRIT